MRQDRLTWYKCSEPDDFYTCPSVQNINRSCLPLKNAIEYAFSLGAKTIIVQSDIQDPDYLAEYNEFYSRLFGKVEKYCQRIHFLSREYDQESGVLEVIDNTDSGQYLGFITLRPIYSTPVGATILRSTGGKAHFLLSKDSFTVNISGRSFEVSGTPFMQQDNAVGACAQASIWMSLRTLRKREGFAAHNPAQITTLATKYMVSGRTLPNREGLQVSQMIEAVRSAGYAPNLLHLPDFIDKKDNETDDAFGIRNITRINTIRDILYPYIESELPVILVLFQANMGHAVVIIGHGWNSLPDNFIQDRIDARFIKAVSWATPYYIHNDNTGPYREMLGQSENDYSLEMARYAIPLFPNDVFMNAQEAEAAAIATIQEVEKHTTGRDKLSLIDDHYVVRTYLQDRCKFRDFVVNTNLSSPLKTYYRMKGLPRRIWVTEINKFDGYGERITTRVGEVLIDPTGEPTEMPFLSAHIPGVLFDRDQDSGDIKFYDLPDDAGYNRLDRTSSN